MATANLTLADGSKVSIEGTAEEVSTLLSRFSVTAPVPSSPRRGKKKISGTAKRQSGRKGPQHLIADLAEEKYFKSKRTISEIQKKLEEKGHIYAMHSLSTPLLRLTRARTLRRIQEKNGWVYVS